MGGRLFDRAGGGVRAPQRLDRLFEGETVVTQDLRRGRTAFADDRRQNEGAADGPALTFLGGGAGRLENVDDVATEGGLAGAISGNAIIETAEIVRDLGDESCHVDAARLEDDSSVAVLGQREEEVLEGDLPVALLVGVGDRALKGAAQIVRHLQTVQDVRRVRSGHLASAPLVDCASRAVPARPERTRRAGAPHTSARTPIPPHSASDRPDCPISRRVIEYHSSRDRHTRQAGLRQTDKAYGFPVTRSLETRDTLAPPAGVRGEAVLPGRVRRRLRGSELPASDLIREKC